MTPRTIIHNGETITNPHNLTGLMNNHYIEKVEEIREDILEPKTLPLKILEKTIPRPSTTFKLKETTVEKRSILMKVSPTTH